jgi:hypothetical protein
MTRKLFPLEGMPHGVLPHMLIPFDEVWSRQLLYLQKGTNTHQEYGKNQREKVEVPQLGYRCYILQKAEAYDYAALEVQE